MKKPNSTDLMLLTALPLCIGLLILPAITFDLECNGEICRKIPIIDPFAIQLTFYFATGIIIYATIVSPKVFNEDNKNSDHKISKSSKSISRVRGKQENSTLEQEDSQVLS